jgi:hypothetical protein
MQDLDDSILPPGPRPVETPDGTDGPPWEPGRLVFPSLDGPMVRRPGPFGSSRVYPPRWERGRLDGRDHIQSTFSPHGGPHSVHVDPHVQSTYVYGIQRQMV